MDELNDIIDRLELRLHPEGGWYREVVRTGELTSILFLLRAGERSRWHRVHGRSEVWLHQAGGPLELDRQPGGRVVLGPDDVHQAVVEPDAWQTARTLGDWTLVGCVVAPPFAFEAFELAPPGWRPPVED